MIPQSIKIIIVRDRLTYSILRLFFFPCLPRGSPEAPQTLVNVFPRLTMVGENCSLRQAPGCRCQVNNVCAAAEAKLLQPAGARTRSQYQGIFSSIVRFPIDILFFAVIIDSVIKRWALFNLSSYLLKDIAHFVQLALGFSRP